MKISQEIRDVAEAEKGMKEKSEEFIEGGKRFIARKENIDFRKQTWRIVAVNDIRSVFHLLLSVVL
jgi:hypothetical protein